MAKFEYGMAYYQEVGIIEAHPEMRDMVNARSGAVGSFLYEAGEKGWEFCGLLPVKDANGYDAWAIFKRQILTEDY